MRILVKRLVASVVCITLCSGCSLFKLRKNLQMLESVSWIEGEVGGLKVSDTVVVAALRQSTAGRSVENYQVLSGQKRFKLVVPEGQYRVVAFIDRNADLDYQQNEPIARSQELRNVSGEVLPFLTLRPVVQSREELGDIDSTVTLHLPSHKASLGKVVDLDNEAFTEANGKLGLWEPVRFAQELPYGLFFLQPYEPPKVPVLFVHGITGHPMNFESIIAGLDRSKFQPWVVFYPSAFRLAQLGDFINQSVSELRVRHGFTKMHVVAHSMGGLVSRSFLNLDAERSGGPLVEKFVSLSTPWGGHAAAASGVESAPVVAPCWIDLVPASEFIQSLFAEPLVAKHLLAFGYKGGMSLFQGNNDGVVSIESQLLPEAQEQAHSVRGFSVDHMEVLGRPEINQLIYDFLE